jgi:hypothetical protein
MNHVTQNELAQLRRGGLAPARIELVLRHLGECGACASAARAPSLDHVAHELPDFLLGRLASARAGEVSEHLKTCAQCAADEDELRRWARSQERVRPAVRWIPLAVAAAISIVLFGLWRARAPRPRNAPPPAIRATGSTPPQTQTARTPSQPRYGRKEWETLVGDALRTGRVPIPADIAGFRAGDVYRSTGAQDARDVLRPSATAIEETQPELAWPRTNAGEYEVVVYADDEEVARSAMLRGTRWRIDKPLQRGQLYRWQVIAADGTILPAPPAAPAAFRIVSARELAELRDARGRHPDDELLLGLLYAKAGVIDRAREHLRNYARTDPSPAASRLLASIE